LPTLFNAYNYARRLKTLTGLRPYEYIYKMLDFSTGTIQA